MEIMEIVTNPYFYVFIIPVIFFMLTMVLVAGTGAPRFARGWPIINRVFKLKLLVFEKRANNYKPVLTYGRRIERPDKTQILETIKYGDIRPPKIEHFNTYGGQDWIVLVMSEIGEFHPALIEDVKDEYGERVIREIDGNGNPMVDETGKAKYRIEKIKLYKFKPITQEQRMFQRDAFYDRLKKYSRRTDWLKQLAPYAIFLLAIVGCIVVLAITWGDVAKVAQALATQSGQASQPIIPKLPVNFSY